MATSRDFATAPARRRIAPGKLVLALMCGLLTVVGIAWAGWQRYCDQLVQEQMAELRAAGEPVTVAELERYYRLPAGREDCTALYLAACQPLDGAAFTADCVALPILDPNVGDAPIVLPPQLWLDLVAVEAFLAKYQPSLEQLHEAARRGGGARYPVDVSMDTRNLEPLISRAAQLRNGVRTLLLEGYARAHRGDAHGAAASMHAAWRLGESMEFEPIAISQLTRLGVVSIPVRQLEKLLPAVDFSDDDLRLLQTDFRGFDGRPALGRICRGERTQGLYALEQTPSADLPRHYALARRAFMGAERSNWLGYMTKLVEASDSPWPDSVTELRQLEEDGARAFEGSLLSLIGKTGIAELQPSVVMMADAACGAAARANAADTALAAELFRRRQNRWPETLEELVPEFLPAVPNDPFDGQPLRMVRRPDGELVIYSIGRDGLDDDGLRFETFGERSDEVFSLRPRPAGTSD